LKSTTLDIQEFIPYAFNITSPKTGLGLGPTTNITLSFQAVVGATYATNSADTYTDVVVLTVTP
jgi:hypothetical protein